MRFALLLLGLPIAAQVLINAGGPAVGAYEADSRFSGGAVWTPAEDPAMGTQSGEFQTLRYGVNFSYLIAVPAPGSYAVSVLMLEPNKTGPGQRKFTVNINGQPSAAIDLFVLSGGKMKPYEADFTVSAEKQITLGFQATIGNAVVSAIVIRRAASAASGVACVTPSELGQAAVYAQLPDGTCYPVTVLFGPQAFVNPCAAHPESFLCATLNPRALASADQMVGWQLFALLCRQGWRAAVNPSGPSETLRLVGCARLD